MAYTTDLPPTCARTADSAYELRTASGDPIDSYSQTAMDHPADWWADILTYIKQNAPTTAAAVEDVTLLMIQQDWDVVDER